MAASQPVSVRVRKAVLLLLGLVGAVAVVALGGPGIARAETVSNHYGELDCNADSPSQQSVRMTALCADIRGFDNESNANTWGGRFYDNGTYIGHDEPDMTFLSNQPGSGNDVTWTETLGRDPTAAPTDRKPGADVSHWFQLSPAPWFSMQLCDSKSYPTTDPCSPESDSNAPTCAGTNITNCFPGGDNAFMEFQLYPPGFPPLQDGISCDDTHWCAAVTIDSLECTLGFATCNGNCEEPQNFAFIQRDGVPTGPPGPQDSTIQTDTPNSETLLMNPGDRITFRMFDAPVPGQRGVRAFEVVVDDLTTHQIGRMQASAANGFMNTSITDCSGTPYNFQPEYNTAGRSEISPWGADITDISTEYETGHWESCTSLTDPSTITLDGGITDPFWYYCNGPYENTAPGGDGSNDPELTDAFCFPQGDTHGALHTAPDVATGCDEEFTQNGDLDFDGSPYWTEWPTGASPTALYPSSFVENLPTTGGRQYGAYFIQSDIGLSESTCQGNTLGGTNPGTPTGCAIPPVNAPGKFYPYWSRARTFTGGCVLEFGNVSSGPGVDDLGKDAQYGSDMEPTLGYPQFLGPIQRNTCGRRQ